MAKLLAKKPAKVVAIAVANKLARIAWAIVSSGKSYRRIAALLRVAGRSVSDGRIERLWRRDGLKVPSKQPKISGLWLNHGSCIRLRAERVNHVWLYDFECRCFEHSHRLSNNGQKMAGHSGCSTFWMSTAGSVCPSGSVAC